MEPERVKIYGAAQFEVYREQPSKNREEICRSLGISSAKKLVLYAGSSKSINEIKHLKVLDRAVGEGKLVDCHIIFRPHPWRAPAEDEPDFHDILWEHVSMDPSMVDFYNSPHKKQTHKISLTSYMDTHNILSATDLLISNMSTILIEAALHGKPVFCMISDADMDASDHLKTTVNSLYFKEFLDHMEIPSCGTFEELPELCRGLLEQSSSNSFSKIQKERARFFVNQGDEPYGLQLRNLVQQIISSQTLERDN